MGTIEQNAQRDIHLEEYKVLKAEQLRRIAVRDHVIYLTIAAVGAILGLIEKLENNFLLLAIPWVGLLLGWTYLVNDQKVSAIGEYIRSTLDDKIKQTLATEQDVFGWESAHRGDDKRIARKRTQLFVDFLAFVLPGVIATVVFITSSSCMNPFRVLAGVEFFLLLILGGQILGYADLKKGK